MPKLKFLERVSLDGRMYEEGDTVTVSDEDAKTCCENGWAEDTEGKIKTGERSTMPKAVKVSPATHKPTLKKV